jgi:hypothetical protein
MWLAWEGSPATIFCRVHSGNLEHHHVEFQGKRKLERLDHNQSQVILLGSRY